MTAEAIADKVENTNDAVVDQVSVTAKYISEQFNIDPSWVWMTQLFVVVFVTLVVSYIAGRSLKQLRKRLENTQTTWDNSLVEAARKPLRLGIWVIGLCYAIEIIYKETGAEIFSGVDAIRDVGIISTLTWWLLRFVRAFEENIVTSREVKGERVDRTTVSAVAKLLKAAIIITSGLIMLQTLGFSVSGVLAFGGVGGIAVGFAAKDILANFFGAMTVYFDRPFCVGDWIRSPDHEIEGTVEHIGWRQTRIRTFDKRPLYVPNSLFTTIAVENPSRMSHRRLFETIGVRYADIGAVQAITDEVREMLSKHEAIDESQTLMVYFDAFNASSVDFFVYCFTHTTAWAKFHEIKHELLLKISEIITSHDAEIAFPTQTLHVPDVLQVQMPQAKNDDEKAKPAAKKQTTKKSIQG